MQKVFWVWLFIGCITTIGLITDQLQISYKKQKVNSPGKIIFAGLVLGPIINAILIIAFFFYLVTNKTLKIK